MIRRREFIEIPGLDSREPGKIKFSKHGITIPARTMIAYGYTRGDVFRVSSLDGNDLALKMIEAPSADTEETPTDPPDHAQDAA